MPHNVRDSYRRPGGVPHVPDVQSLQSGRSDGGSGRSANRRAPSWSPAPPQPVGRRSPRCRPPRHLAWPPAALGHRRRWRPCPGHPCSPTVTSAFDLGVADVDGDGVPTFQHRPQRGRDAASGDGSMESGADVVDALVVEHGPDVSRRRGRRPSTRRRSGERWCRPVAVGVRHARRACATGWRSGVPKVQLPRIAFYGPVMPASLDDGIARRGPRRGRPVTTATVVGNADWRAAPPSARPCRVCRRR